MLHLKAGRYSIIKKANIYLNPYFSRLNVSWQTQLVNKILKICLMNTEESYLKSSCSLPQDLKQDVLLKHILNLFEVVGEAFASFHLLHRMWHDRFISLAITEKDPPAL